MTTRKLCRPCANDTAVHGRCPALEVINKPGTICDRCLSDGRLLASYRICCEPENQWGHTAECRREQKLEKGMTHPTLQRFAVTLFSTDARVLALTNTVLDDPDKRLATLGRAWDLGADGHEPEATYRKEAEDRAFRMQKFDRELQEYIKETVRLTRESARKADLKAGQEANGRLPPPLPQAEHQADEAERNRQHYAKLNAESDARQERLEKERAERKAAHPECGARSPIHPAGRTLEQGGLHVGAFDGERCTKQKHDYGDHQFVVNGRVMSGWNANAYYVGEDQARATSRTQRSVMSKYEDPPLTLGMGLLRDAHLEENSQVMTCDPPPRGDLCVYDLPRTGKEVGAIDKGASLSIISVYDADWALVHWKGTEKRPAVKGYVRRQYLAENVKRGGRLDNEPRLLPSFGTDCRGNYCGVCGECSQLTSEEVTQLRERVVSLRAHVPNLVPAHYPLGRKP